MKRTNKCTKPNNGYLQAESAEQRPPNKGNSGQTTGIGTQRPKATSLGLDRVREAAKRDPALKFNNLMHHITTDQLHKAYLQLNPKAAAGWTSHGTIRQRHPKRLQTLHEQIQSANTGTPK